MEGCALLSQAREHIPHLPASCQDVSMTNGVSWGFLRSWGGSGLCAAATWLCCGQPLGLWLLGMLAVAVLGGLSSCAQGWLFRVMPWWGADSKPLFLQTTAHKKRLPMCKYPVLPPARPSGVILVPVLPWCSHGSACAGQEELTVLLFSQGAHIFWSLPQLHQDLQSTPGQVCR